MHSRAAVIEFRGQLVRKHPGDIFAGWVHVVEWRHIVEKCAFVWSDERAKNGSDVLEIEHPAGFVELRRSHCDPNAPAVGVWRPALAGDASNLVPSNESCDDGDFPHRPRRLARNKGASCGDLPSKGTLAGTHSTL